MKPFPASLIAAFALALPSTISTAAPSAPATEKSDAIPEVASNTRFLTNANLKIGIDLSSGGAIFWLSELPGDRNLLNHADRGRFIQQSYYGQPDGSQWAGKPWRWNPVQGGHYRGKPATLVTLRQEQESLYIKSIPVNWAGGETLDECRMEQWIELKARTAHIRFRFSYQGTTTHPATHQEMPAVFIDSALTDLVRYEGKSPWTGGALTVDRPGWPNEYRKPTEPWAAFVGADRRGLGVLFPGSDQITTYRHPGPEGPKGGGCSYFAPIRTLAITPGKVIDYRIWLTIGTVDEIRARFKEIATAPAATSPDR